MSTGVVDLAGLVCAAPAGAPPVGAYHAKRSYMVSLADQITWYSCSYYQVPTWYYSAPCDQVLASIPVGLLCAI